MFLGDVCMLARCTNILLRIISSVITLEFTWKIEFRGCLFAKENHDLVSGTIFRLLVYCVTHEVGHIFGKYGNHLLKL